MNTVRSLQRLAAYAAAILLFSAASLHAGNFTTLYVFTGGTGPANPSAGVTLVGSTLYGTTASGGTNNGGAVFSYNLNTGVESTLHSFSGSGISGGDGEALTAGVTLLGSTLYGSTSEGGGGLGGTLFSVGTNGLGFNSLLSFAEQGAYPSNDGTDPYANLTAVGSLLYGTTTTLGPAGGANVGGTLFSYNPGNGQITDLHSFGAIGDGSAPYGALVDAGSILYGTTFGGGAYGVATNGDGTIFSYNIATGQETVLYSFLGPTSGDGKDPIGGLTLVGSTLYGTTNEGGADRRSGDSVQLQP